MRPTYSHCTAPTGTTWAGSRQQAGARRAGEVWGPWGPGVGTAGGGGAVSFQADERDVRAAALALAAQFPLSSFTAHEVQEVDLAAWAAGSGSLTASVVYSGPLQATAAAPSPSASGHGTVEPILLTHDYNIHAQEVAKSQLALAAYRLAALLNASFPQPLSQDPGTYSPCISLQEAGLSSHPSFPAHLLPLLSTGFYPLCSRAIYLLLLLASPPVYDFSDVPKLSLYSCPHQSLLSSLRPSSLFPTPLFPLEGSFAAHLLPLFLCSHLSPLLLVCSLFLFSYPILPHPSLTPPSLLPHPSLIPRGSLPSTTVLTCPPTTTSHHGTCRGAGGEGSASPGNGAGHGSGSGAGAGGDAVPREGEHAAADPRPAAPHAPP
ncbi:unnamed protein product [Closterium sp. Yama58-4]|nr:unnamed protein product [Closterium sp. Yama58-4]